MDRWVTCGGLHGICEILCSDGGEEFAVGWWGVFGDIVPKEIDDVEGTSGIGVAMCALVCRATLQCGFVVVHEDVEGDRCGTGRKTGVGVCRVKGVIVRETKVSFGRHKVMGVRRIGAVGRFGVA